VGRLLVAWFVNWWVDWWVERSIQRFGGVVLGRRSAAVFCLHSNRSTKQDDLTAVDFVALQSKHIANNVQE
jgi:hypothetical protein